jgi:hypothetical protein
LTPAARFPIPEIQQAPANDYGLDNCDLPLQLQNAIIEAVKKVQTQERYLRLQEILEDSQDRLYDMGIQHIFQNRNFCWTQAISGERYATSDGGEDTFGDYIGDYNIYTAFMLIQQAKISEPEIGIDFQPINPDDADDRESAAAAEGIRKQFDIDVDSKDIAQQKVYFMQMGGRAVTWVQTENDIAPFGTTGDGKPRRRMSATVGGTLEWRVPIFAQKIEQWGFALYYDDPDIMEARDEYGWIADKLTPGQTCLNENAYERIGRLSVVQSNAQNYRWNIADSMNHLISRGRCWLRLNRFWDAKDAFVGDDGEREMVQAIDKRGNAIERPKTVKEKIAEIFPRGVMATIVGKNYAKAENRSMDDDLSVCHAYIGKGQSRKPIGKEMVLVQDGFNQTINYIREKNDFCVPSTWLNEDMCDFDAITKQRARPGSFRALKDLPPGTTIEQCVYRESETGIPSGFMEFAEFLQSNLPQFQMQLPPSVWGAATTDTKVAEVYQASASQAMGIQGKLRTRVVASMAVDYYHACLAVSRDEQYPEQITVNAQGQKGRSISVRKDSLTKGNFRCYPDKNSGFPETTSQTRQSLTNFAQLVAPTPLAMQIWSTPSNVAEMVRVQGLNLTVPEAESWAKQSREIEILLRTPPRLKSPVLVALMTQGAGVQAMVDAIKGIIAQAQAQSAAQAQQESQAEFEKEYAAQVLAAQAQGLPTPPKPPMPPAPIPPTPKLSTVAQSSVTVRDSDFHSFEGNKCRDWLSSTECWNEETLGRPDPDNAGTSKPNIAGVLNVTLHWMEHVEKAAMEAPPTGGPSMTGPLPPIGSPPKQPALAAGAQ